MIRLKNFPNYSVTERGQIWSHHSGKFLKSAEDVNGYLTVNLSHKGVRRNQRVHRLVAEAFLENPEGLPYVNHLDGNKKNNLLQNLEWCTPQENSKHASHIGRLVSGEEHSLSKLSQIECNFIKLWLDRGYSPKEIQSCFEASRSVISNIKLNKHWSSNKEALCLA